MPLVAVDISDKRLAISRNGGADAGLNSRAQDFQTRLTAATDNRGPAVVFECTGLADPVTAAFDLCADGGRVVLLAGTRGLTRTDFYRDVHRKGITIIGAHSGARPQSERRPGAWTQREDTQVALKLLLSRRLDVRSLITHRHAGADAAKAYANLIDWKEDLMGVLLDWR
jgi:L-iditol 2-dehydrogenase